MDPKLSLHVITVESGPYAGYPGTSVQKSCCYVTWYDVMILTSIMVSELRCSNLIIKLPQVNNSSRLGVLRG